MENRQVMNKDKKYFFTCEECGSHELYVEYSYTIRCGTYYETYSEVGELDHAHHIEWYDKGIVESGHDNDYADDEDDVDVEGDESDGPEWVIDEESEEWYVRCCCCDREIEFGWSRPNRGGRIWPAECADFKPWRCFSEPRYYQEWKRRNWLRPPSTEY